MNTAMTWICTCPFGLATCIALAVLQAHSHAMATGTAWTGRPFLFLSSSCLATDTCIHTMQSACMMCHQEECIVQIRFENWVHSYC